MQRRVANCEYNEYDRRLTEQFIHGLEHKNMIGEILREITALENNDDATSECICICAQRLEVQRMQKELLDNIRDQGI